jgi:Flp pilus assembly protein TadB
VSNYRQRATYIVGAVIPCLFLGLWWLALAPAAYWLLKRTIALLPTSDSIAQQKARETEALFFLAAFNGCLKSGLPLLSALTTVATLLTTSLKVDLERIYSLLTLGAEPIQAWGVLANDPDLAPLARAIPAAQVDGRSLAVVVERVSTLCYENSVKRSRERVKSLSVKLALPVGLCFLPSFLIGGIGPVVYSFFASMRIF